MFATMIQKQEMISKKVFESDKCFKSTIKTLDLRCSYVSLINFKLFTISCSVFLVELGQVLVW